MSCVEACKPGQNCGTCVKTYGPCSTGYQCNQNTMQCTPFCSVDSDCSAPKTCVDGQCACVNRCAALKYECGSDPCGNVCGSCPDGKRCNQNKCVEAKKCSPPCDDAHQCVDGQCIQKQQFGTTFYTDKTKSNPCAHGGDSMQCTGSGVCVGDGTDYGGPWEQQVDEHGVWTSNSCAQDWRGARNRSPDCKQYGWFFDPSAQCKCDEGYSGIACQIPPGQTANEFGYPGSPVLQHYTYNAGEKTLELQDTGTATTTDYNTLDTAGGMCGQNWQVNLSQIMPYEIDPVTGKATDVRIQAALAPNTLMFGERVHRPDKNWANYIPYYDSMAAGIGCGSCWRLTKKQNDGSIKSLTGVVVDRCGGNCLMYPSLGVQASSGLTFPKRWVDNAGRGADWRDLLKDETNKPFFPFLNNSDCSNTMSSVGYESGLPAAKAPSVTDNSATGQAERLKLAEWYGKDVVDWCAANDHPHFDISLDEHSILCGGTNDPNCVADTWEMIPCTPIGYKTDSEPQEEGVWPNGCDRTGFMNCGSTIPVWDPNHPGGTGGGDDGGGGDDTGGGDDGGGGDPDYGLALNWGTTSGTCCTGSGGKYGSAEECESACKTSIQPGWKWVTSPKGVCPDGYYYSGDTCKS